MSAIPRIPCQDNVGLSAEQQNSAGCDPKPAAAFRLGFCSRWTGVDVMRDALGVLVDDVDAKALSNLEIAFTDMSRSRRDWEDSKRLDKNANGYNRRRALAPRWTPDIEQNDTVRRWIDLALPKSSCYRKWFDLGCAFGNCVPPSSLDKSAVDEINTALRRLRQDFLARYGILTRLLESAINPKRFKAAIRAIINRKDSKKIKACFVNESGRPEIRIAELIIWEIKHELLECAPKTPEAEERDRFIYQEVLKDATYEEIMKKVNANPEWTPLGFGSSVRAALNRYTAQHGLSRVPNRPRGRRPKMKR